MSAAPTRARARGRIAAPRPRNSPMKRLPFLLLALLLPCLPLTAARGDEVPLSAEEEERLEAIDRHTKRGIEAFQTGNHEEVLERMKRLAKYDPQNPLPLYLTGRVKERTGKYDEALNLAAAAAVAHPDHLPTEALRYRVLLALGRHDVAATAARARLRTRSSAGNSPTRRAATMSILQQTSTGV